MLKPMAFIVDAETYPAACKKLQEVPRDQWPDPADYDRVFIGCRLFEMEQSEI